MCFHCPFVKRNPLFTRAIYTDYAFQSLEKNESLPAIVLYFAF